MNLFKEVAIDKPFIANTAQSIISAINEGELNPIDLKLRLKAIESVIETIKPVLDKAARDEAEKYGAKSFERLGARIELIEAGTKYDYSNCNDEQYKDLIIELEKLKLKIKQREKFLQSIDGSMNIVTKDGEGVTVFAPIKTSTSTIKITL